MKNHFNTWIGHMSRP